MQTEHELKSCPYCGGEVEYLLDQTTEQNHSVNCKKCCFSISRFYHGNSYLDKWNTRHAPDVDLAMVLGALRDAINAKTEPHFYETDSDYQKGWRRGLQNGWNDCRDAVIAHLEAAVKGERNDHA